jgi:hypothetical protein
VPLERAVTPTGPERRLKLEDIEDLRVYERGRDTYRRQVIELKRRRRVAVGRLVTLLFENRETVRFQVQEMVRIEKMLLDEQVQGELDVYNPLIPAPGELSATLFIELTSEADLREWMGKLVGIERSVELRLGRGDGDDGGAYGRAGGAITREVVRSIPEAAHEEALTREMVTPSVHYVKFLFTPEQVERFATGPVALAVNHPAYEEETYLSEDVRNELLTDLRP